MFQYLHCRLYDFMVREVIIWTFGNNLRNYFIIKTTLSCINVVCVCLTLVRFLLTYNGFIALLFTWIRLTKYTRVKDSSYPGVILLNNLVQVVHRNHYFAKHYPTGNVCVPHLHTRWFDAPVFSFSMFFFFLFDFYFLPLLSMCVCVFRLYNI